MWISFLFLWERVLLSARTESNQWPRPPSLAPLGQFTLRCAKGTPSMNTSPQAGVHRRRPPGPHITGDALLKNFYTLPAALRQDLYSFSPRPTGAFVVAKSALFRTPKCGHPSCRSLAPPLPTKPASLGFGGDPN